mgnify:CR=1 FL=1
MIALCRTLASGAAALLIAAPAAAQTLVSDGAWRAAYATLSDGDAVCAAETRSGDARLTVMAFSNGDLALAVEDPDWRMPVGAVRVLTLEIGDEGWAVAVRAQGKAAFADLRTANGRRALAALSDRRAITLRAGAGAKPRRFSTEGVANALAAFERCAKTRPGVRAGRPTRAAAAQ